MRLSALIAGSLALLTFSLDARQDGAAAESLRPQPVAKIDSSGFLDLGIVRENHLFLPLGPTTYRVGGGVFVRVVTYTKVHNIATVVSLLLACDGSWISGALRLDPFPARTEISLTAILQDAIAREESLPLEPIFLEQSSKSQLFFGKILTRQAATICESAAPEPRNQLIPVALTVADGDTGESFALVTGTTSRNGQTIDIWTRISQYKEAPFVDPEGKPIKSSGESLRFKEVTGVHTLVRRAFDCKARTTAAFEVFDYTATGKVSRSESESRETLRLTSVVPGSVGEALMDMACSLYLNQLPQ